MTTVNVKAKHIAKGKREDCERCPVALAIWDAIPGIDGVAVASDEISISRGDLWIPFRAPSEVRDFIQVFDCGSEPAEPFTFELGYPAVTS